MSDQVRHLTRLIGQFGIKDAFMIDIFAKELTGLSLEEPAKAEVEKAPPKEVPLPKFDVDERIATTKAASVTYQNRHNKMTEALKKVLKGLELVTCYERHLQFDILVKNYDGASSQLLIEAKPDPDKGAIRIAIGQLFKAMQ